MSNFSEQVLTPSTYVEGFYTYKDIMDSLEDVSFANKYSSIRRQHPTFVPYWKLRIGDYISTVFYSMKYLADKNARHGVVLSDLMIDVLPMNKLSIQSLNQPGISINIADAIDYWRQLMTNKKCKIIFIYTRIQHGQSNETHANWTIIDKPRKVVEFFDPLGHSSTKTIHTTDWEKLFTRVFQTIPQTKIIPRKYKIVSYKVTCPEYGFQSIENIIGATPDDVNGYCMLWTVFMLDFRMKNIKNRNLKALQQEIIDVTAKRLYEHPHSMNIHQDMGVHFREFIKDYGLYLHKLYINSIYPQYTSNLITQYY